MNFYKQNLIVFFCIKGRWILRDVDDGRSEKILQRHEKAWLQSAPKTYS